MYRGLHILVGRVRPTCRYRGRAVKRSDAGNYVARPIIGLVILMLNRGIGAALKDAMTLYAAPCLVAFELALWQYAPKDMTWHVTDYLWMGGTNDGGYRALDVAGAYLVSNWLVVCVALLLVASRIPWILCLRGSFGDETRPSSARRLSSFLLPSSRWQQQRPRGRLEVPRVGIAAPMALLSRRHSGFCGLNRLDESAKADHYSRKLYQASRIEIL